MMHDGGGATKAKRTGAPYCTQMYHPTTGGIQADYIESHGSPGAYPIDISANPDAPSEEGSYNHAKVAAHGNYPHSGADPEVEGPPIGTIAGPNGAIRQG